jgi:hypothetical protein
MAASVAFVEIDELVVGTFRPASWRLMVLAGKDADSD